MTQIRIARIISVIFHPLLIMSLGMLVIFNSGTSLAVLQPEIKRAALVIVFLFTGVFPVAMILLLYLTRMLHDIFLKNRKDRNLPIQLALVMLLLTYFVMRWIPQLSAGHAGYVASQVVGLLVVFFLNKFVKPSIHMLGLGGLLGLMLVLVIFFGARIQFLFIAAVLAAGLTATARVFLGVHTLKEVALGFIVGIVTTSLTIVLHLL